MHEISPKSAEAALRHAEISQKHGESIETVGKLLQGQEGASADVGQVIEERGQWIQEHAQASKEYAKLAQINKTASTEAFVMATSEHGKAVEEHVAAVKAYLAVAQKNLEQRRAEQIEQRILSEHEQA